MAESGTSNLKPDERLARAQALVDETTTLMREYDDIRKAGDLYMKMADDGVYIYMKKADDGAVPENIEPNVERTARSANTAPCACCSHCCILL